ncbi:MAG: alpha/beta hydrolase [Burkholderiales bacterium]|nr:alpha/beta hydrolase [Burkholderiales bacterium]
MQAQSSASVSMPDTEAWSYLGEQERQFSVMREGAALTSTRLRTDDGISLHALSCGQPGRPVVLLANAVGVSALFIARLAKALAVHYHVVSWESRGMPDIGTTPLSACVSLERQCQDALAVLRHFDCKPSAVVSYCSGSNVAAYALSTRLMTAQAWCAVSPSINVATANQTDYQRTMLPLWRRLAEGNPRQAALVKALLARRNPSEETGPRSELLHLNGLPFASGESTYQYARLQAACMAPEWAPLLNAIAVPTLICHGTQDVIIHRDTSDHVARHVPGAQLIDIPDSGHFSVYESDRLHTEILHFLQRSLRTHTP